MARVDGKIVNIGDAVGFKCDIEQWGYRDWETDRKSTRLNSSHRL